MHAILHNRVNNQRHLSFPKAITLLNNCGRHKVHIFKSPGLMTGCWNTAYFNESVSTQCCVCSVFYPQLSMPSLSLHAAFASFFAIPACKDDGPWCFQGFRTLTGMDSLSADNPPLGYTRDEIVLIKTYLTEYSLLEPKARIAFSKKKVIALAKGRELWRRLVQQISNKIGIPALIAKSMEESDVNPFWQQAQTGTWPTARQCVGKYSDCVARNLLGNETVPGNMIRATSTVYVALYHIYT